MGDILESRVSNVTGITLSHRGRQGKMTRGIVARNCFLKNLRRSSCCGSVVMNPASSHGAVGSIPGPAQWVKDPALSCGRGQQLKLRFDP